MGRERRENLVHLAILDCKKVASQCVVDEAMNGDDFVAPTNPETMKKLQIFRGAVVVPSLSRHA
ncbi:hypothetical protein MKW98_001904 [Papaver atlanticum]|uniref:Uncharacterized protein n=1 Tax=Papaver atlanticum TaxID=357466 RepID=A0AAD4T207_9MAGN|nr:hypothetical protein MKW98_001904 [Papaver atlanticum]